MSEYGFDYVLSEEDTGTGDVIHKASSATEWWVVFYKPAIVNVANYSLITNSSPQTNIFLSTWLSLSTCPELTHSKFGLTPHTLHETAI